MAMTLEPPLTSPASSWWVNLCSAESQSWSQNRPCIMTLISNASSPHHSHLLLAGQRQLWDDLAQRGRWQCASPGRHHLLRGWGCTHRQHFGVQSDRGFRDPPGNASRERALCSWRLHRGAKTKREIMGWMMVECFNSGVKSAAVFLSSPMERGKMTQMDTPNVCDTPDEAHKWELASYNFFTSQTCAF